MYKSSNELDQVDQNDLISLRNDQSNQKWSGHIDQNYQDDESIGLLNDLNQVDQNYQRNQRKYDHMD